MNRLFSNFLWVLPLGLYLAATSPAASGQATSETTPRSFIKLTLPDGSEGRLPPNTVIRIRKAISTENRNGAKARIDWLQMMLVREPPAEVAALVEGNLPSLGKLLLPDGSPVCFNAGAAQGPMPLPPERLQDGVRSGMMLGNKLQYLASTPEEVRDELIAKGGDALPVPAAFDSLPQREQAIAKSRVAPMKVWDSDLTQ
ncbi:MAG TPA: hypothetical protein VHK26_10595 [Methyloceanibacter sp.]|jgi:hypothetical protein|nr:hypothetical protein [Methyloceanibacter sp.]